MKSTLWKICIGGAYLYQIFGFFQLYGLLGGIIAFVFPPAMLAYPFFYRFVTGGWPIIYIAVVILGLFVFAPSAKKDEGEDNKATEL